MGFANSPYLVVNFGVVVVAVFFFCGFARFPKLPVPLSYKYEAALFQTSSSLSYIKSFSNKTKLLETNGNQWDENFVVIYTFISGLWIVRGFYSSVRFAIKTLGYSSKGITPALI